MTNAESLPVRLSVTIPTYRADELVTRAVRALGPTPEECELIVVDDGSGGNAADRLHASIPEAAVVALDTNRGFGAAVNAGFQAAAGKYLATLNNDALTSWHDLGALADFLDANPDVAAVGPAIVDSRGRTVQMAFRFPRPAWSKLLSLRQARVFRRRVRAETLGDAPFRVEYLKGACVVFRRTALEQVGLFDEQFWLFAEEIDLCRRCIDQGWGVWVVPAGRILHAGGATTRNHPDRAESSRYRQQSYRSICRYFAKHHSPPARYCLRLELALRVLGRMFAEAARLVAGRGEAWWVAEHARCLRILLRAWGSEPREGKLRGRSPSAEPG